MAYTPDPQVVEAVDTVLADGLAALDLEWLHGQGSRVAGFSEHSDLDLVAVCTSLPTARVLQESTRFEQGEVVLEKTVAAGVEVDVMLVTHGTFENWTGAVESGRSWCSPDWPDPLYAVAGLAHGHLLRDRSGAGARVQGRLAQPSSSFVRAVTGGVRTAAPGFLAEMHPAATRGDAWLHQKLTTELTRMLHVLMCARAGSYAPFPKHVTAWLERLSIPAQWREAYLRVYEVESAAAQNEAVADLTELLLLDPGREGEPSV